MNTDFFKPTKGKLLLALIISAVFLFYFFSASSYRQCAPSMCSFAVSNCASNESECFKCSSSCSGEAVSLCMQGDVSAVNSIVYRGCGQQKPMFLNEFESVLGGLGSAAYVTFSILISYLLSCFVFKAASLRKFS